MCFSPQVDVVVGAAIAVVAVDSIRHCRSALTAPLAALPAIFAVHTLISAVVWWGLSCDVPADVGHGAAMAYLAIAFVLLPVYVPLAVLLIEPPGWRRGALIALTVMGAVAGADFAQGLVRGGDVVAACSYYIDFQITGTSTLGAALYVVATCGALLLSGQRPLVLWGLLNVVAIAVLVLFERRGLPSLWCFWAAATSVFIAWYLRSIDPRGGSGGPPAEAPADDSSGVLSTGSTDPSGVA